MKRWIVALGLVGVILHALAINTGASGNQVGEQASKDSRGLEYVQKTDKEITEFIYDATIPWPFRHRVGDADGDGVSDTTDKCPNTPAGIIVDESGCPKDSDGDGVYDGIDRCPGTPAGARVDGHGCAGDEDGDGVVDGIDKCPGTPKGAYVDQMGCPKDTDGDGVYDGIDKCSGTPTGTRVDPTGCPITRAHAALVGTGVLSTNEIVFATGKAEIKPESEKILGEVGEVLIARPDIKVEIGGHTDSQGADAMNQRLSEKRANAVRDYLRAKFPQIEKDRLKTKGYGEIKPIASNDTADGRAKNRRVEFKVLQ